MARILAVAMRDDLRIAGARELLELPAGHNGNTSHPRAYAARLREILRDTD